MSDTQNELPATRTRSRRCCVAGEPLASAQAALVMVAWARRDGGGYSRAGRRAGCRGLCATWRRRPRGYQWYPNSFLGAAGPERAVALVGAGEGRQRAGAGGRRRASRPSGRCCSASRRARA